MIYLKLRQEGRVVSVTVGARRCGRITCLRPYVAIPLSVVSELCLTSVN